MKFSALVHEDIPANRLVCFGGLGSVPDRDPDTVYLRLAREEELPDLVATGALTAGETVTAEITGSPHWTVEAAEDIWAGTLVTTAADGKLQIFKDGVQYIGYSTHSAKAGELVTFVRKPGLQWSHLMADGAHATTLGAEQGVQDLTALKKDELIVLAEERGIEVTGAMTKAEIVEALEAAGDGKEG